MESSECLPFPLVRVCFVSSILWSNNSHINTSSRSGECFSADWTHYKTVVFADTYVSAHSLGMDSNNGIGAKYASKKSMPRIHEGS